MPSELVEEDDADVSTCEDQGKRSAFLEQNTSYEIDHCLPRLSTLSTWSYASLLAKLVSQMTR